MKTDLELLKEYLQSEIDCGNHKLFIFDENNNATELKTIDGLNAITDSEQEIERLNNIINEIEKELKEYFNRIGENKKCVNTFYSQAIYNDIEHILYKLEELKESGNK